MDQPRSLLGIDHTAVLGLQFHGLSRWGQFNIEQLALVHGNMIALVEAKSTFPSHKRPKSSMVSYITTSFHLFNVRGSGQKNFSVLGSIPKVGV
jgi:hypothetical protein